MAYEALLVAAMAMRGPLVRETQLRFGIPAPAAVVAAQIAQESAFDPRAQSPVGARGLLQFMPKTASWAQSYVGVGSPDDPMWSLRAGVWYMRWLYDRVKYPSECHQWGAALSGYNGGIGWHARRQANASDPRDFWHSVRTVNPGVSPASQRENEQYSYRIVFVLQPHFARLGGRMIC